MSKKVSEDAKKAFVSSRLVEIGLKHGVFVLVFDAPMDMNTAVEDMKLGADIRAAIEAERARLSAEEQAATTRH